MGLLLFVSLLVPQYGWAVSEAKNCTPEPTTNMAIAYGTVLSGVDCFITPVADLDSFVFTAAANDKIRLQALKVGGGYYAVPCVDLRDPDGLPVGNPVCSGNVQINQTLTKPGTYKVLVTESGNDDTVQYNLSLHRVFPFPASALPIKYGQVLGDEINPSTDLDFFVFTGSASDWIRINASKTAGGYYAVVCFEVYQPDAALLGQKQCGTNPLLDIVLSQTGTYYILVSEDGNDDVVTYNLGAQCLSGPCKVVQTCTLKDTPTYDAASKTLTMNFTVGNTFPANWNAWLTYQNTIASLFSLAQPITDPPATITKTRANLSKAGKVGVLSTLTTPKQGVVCSSWVVINTGTPGTAPDVLAVIEEGDREIH